MIRYRLFFLLAVCLLSYLLVLPVYGQDFPTLHYTVEDGLPSNTIYDLYRDSKGFLWIATDKGVARYNGIKFETFSTFNGLPDNEIFFFQEDCYNRLWLATYNGELCYYQNDTFHTAANTPFLKLPVKTSFTKYINVENDSSVTIGFFEQNVFLNIVKNKCNVYKMSAQSYTDVLGIHRVVNISKVSNIMYEHICANGYSLFIDTNSRVIKVRDNNINLNLFFQFSQNQRCYYNEQFIFSVDKKVLKTFPKGFLVKDNVLRIFAGDNRIYIGTNSGLFIDDTTSILKGNRVASMTQDINGNYWIGTLNNGIFKLSKDYLKERACRNAYKSAVRYSTNIQGHLFFTLANNNLYQLENGKTNCLFNYAGYKKGKYLDKLEGAYLIDNNYKYYNFYSDDHIVIPNVLHPRQNVEHYTNFHFTAVKSLFAINSFLYFQIYRRITKLDYKHLARGGDLHGREKVLNDTVHNYIIFCFAKDGSNNLWYNNIDNTYKLVNDIGVSQPQLSNISFKSFDFCGDYLIGYTHQNELLVCSNFDKNIKIDTVRSQNCIWDKFYKLDSNHVLISTNNHYRLLTLNPAGADKRFSISAIEDPFFPLRAESICVDSTHCFFFKDGNITSVEINSLLVVPSPPRLFFTVLKAGKRTYLMDKEIDIPFESSKNISVSFSTLSFGGKNVFYQYSVSKNGKDNWREIKGEEINLINPGYGNYTVKIRARTVSTDYSKPEVFALHILRPYWATWWFIALCICIAAAVIGYIIRLRISYALKKNEKEHDTQVRFMRSEYKALNALMNPHFIFNTLNNVQGLVNRNDKLAANEYLRVFADIIRQNMHNVSKELIPLQKEVDLITNYLLLEKLRFKDFLNYSINIDESADLSEILVPPLLVQPLVENSIKHGIFPLQSSEGTILINIYERGGKIFIEVRDNGVGMWQSKNIHNPLHESFGLENIRKRIAQLSIIQGKEIVFGMEEITDNQGKHLWTVATISMTVST